MDSYKEVFREYCFDFRRKQQGNSVVWMLLLVQGCLFYYKNGITIDWLASIPVVFAVISGCVHKQGMPDMMFLLPVSREKREEYLQKMLYVKIGVPLLFSLVVDAIHVLISAMQPYVVIIQIFYVLRITFTLGILYNGTGFDGKRSVWAKGDVMNTFCVVPLLEMGAILTVCSGDVSTIEFWAVTIGAILFNLPGTIYAIKIWKEIRCKLADYEFINGVMK